MLHLQSTYIFVLYKYCIGVIKINWKSNNKEQNHEQTERDLNNKFN